MMRIRKVKLGSFAKNYKKGQRQGLANFGKGWRGKMVIAIDFDGCIVESDFPRIIGFKKNALVVLNRLKSDGHILILWTCRTEINLYNAIMFLKENGFCFDYVNMHTIPNMQLFKNDTRKIAADLYIDDKQLGGIPDDWEDIYMMINKPTKPGLRFSHLVNL